MYEQTINNDVTMTGGEHPLLAGRYQVVRQLGTGGMGSVWLVEDTQLDNKLFAVKMLPSILVSNKRAYRQLKDEALVAMKLVHSNIVQIRAFEENDGNPFLVMDYIEGQTLDDYLADKGTLSEEEALQYLKPVAAALDYAHGEGVVHRDIKPANVMVRKDGRPFVLDFGVAREIQEAMTRVTGKLSSGTLMYMSPEQVNGALPASPQDVYSFAAMLYECLKGEPPFVRGQLEYQILHNPPPPLPSGKSSSLASAVIRGLAKRPEDRPETCGSMLNVDGDIQSYTQLAIKHYKIDECAEAFAAAQKADKDNSEIQYIIGRCYRYGDGVEEDCSKAMQWYRKAASQGSMNALYEIGDLYDENTSDPYYEGFDEASSDDFTKWLSVSLKCESPRARYRFARAYVNCVYNCNHPELELEKKIGKETDIELIRIAAANGYCEAQYQLGLRYENGDGVSQDYSEAVKWYREAGKNSSQDYYARKLGELYRKGLGVQKDYNEAIRWYRKAVELVDNGGNVINLAEIYELAGRYQESAKWYRKAAERGIANAQCKLGVMYAQGQGVAKDDGEAYKWHLKAAEQGDCHSQYSIGLLLQKGMGVDRNDVAAVKWFRKAAEQGDAGAQFCLGKCLGDGKGVARNQVEAAKWYGKAVEQSNPEAQYCLGLMYWCGNGVAKDEKTAICLIHKAAEQGNSKAQDCLGFWYFEGMGGVQDYAEASKWFKKAAEQGEMASQYYLAKMYYSGAGVTKDVGEAARLFGKLVERNHIVAQYALGVMYCNGEGVEQDYDKGIELLSKSAKGGDKDAQYALGILYENGEGVSRDLAKAIEWYRKAATGGHQEAADILKKMGSAAYDVKVCVVATDKMHNHASTIPLPDGCKMEMIYCAPGEFLMGSPLFEDERASDEVQHKVIIAKGFWLGKYPVTQEQWKSVMGDNPSYFKGEQNPVDNVSWDDCHRFIKKFNSLLSGRCVARLPTEAEWEYACRAGTATAFHWGNVLDAGKANCKGFYGTSEKASIPFRITTTPVGRYKANPWGFYDMHGNVGEWCEDNYAEYGGDIENRGGMSIVNESKYKVLRGGSCIDEAHNCRSARRDKNESRLRDCSFGFRLCCSRLITLAR